MWRYRRDEKALANGVIANFPADIINKNSSFKFKQEIKGIAGYDRTKNIEIMVPLKYLISFEERLKCR